jgi:L-iditol 2-dehydrogenase
MIVTDECGSGHESAGEVIEVGEGVLHLKVGDRVAIEAGVPCGQADCDPCREGEYKACKSGPSSEEGGSSPGEEGGTLP